MKTIIKSTFVVALVALLSSCATTLPLSVSEVSIGSKKGVSSTGILFGSIYLNGKYGVADAVKNGGLKEGVAIIDVKTTDYVIFMKKELMVYGN